MIIHKRIIRRSRGQGIFDRAIENKDGIGENTKEIIKELKALPNNKEISNIVDRINKLRVEKRKGFGFAYI